MPQLTALKNNARGKSSLDALIGGTSPLDWMMKTLPSLPLREERLPWKILLLRYEEDLRVLARHQDPLLRLHACSILLYTENRESRRLLWEMFSDCERSLRILMNRRFDSSDRHRLYNTLLKVYLNDPVADVRQSAYRRIRRHFSDLYSIQPSALRHEEKIHCLEQLDIKSAHDHDMALQLMKDPHPGVVLAAGLYLEKAGTLDSMIRKASLKNRDDLDRRTELLVTASKHKLISFLEKKENFGGTASLAVALSIYEGGIGSALFAWTLEQIFSLKGNRKFHSELKERALHCLTGRKDPESLLLVKTVLETENNEILRSLLEQLPPEGASVYYPVLRGFMMDSSFAFTESLYKAFRTISLHHCLSDLTRVIRDSTQTIKIRNRALVILTSYHEYSCTLFMLENLDLLEQEEMRELALSLPSFNREHLVRTVLLIFSRKDARLQRSLMELLSAADEKQFIPQMEELLLSPEAETRISALQSLQKLDSSGSIEQMKGLLHDRELPVRAHTAAAFIEWNREECISEIRLILEDSHESQSVQSVILKAIAASENRTLIPLVTSLFEGSGPDREILIETLLNKRGKEEIKIILSQYKEAGTGGRESLQSLFKRMEAEGEAVLLKLLGENYCAPEIREILEQTGYVDRMTGEMKSLFPERRRTAAENLSLISTDKACRGLLTGVRDISSAIRSLCLSSLEQAQTSRGVLDKLKEDQDSKVRRLALWSEAKLKKAGSS